MLKPGKENGVPRGIRTLVNAVKGRRPGPLDDGDVQEGYKTNLTCPFAWPEKPPPGQNSAARQTGHSKIKGLCQ